jgi:PPM family protein phosphatase
MSPTLLSAAGSDVGRRRAMNQDSAAASTRLLVVADGMGGHAHGEVASAVAVEAVMELEKRLATDLSDVDLTAELGTALDEAATRLTNLAQDDPQLRGTGTTVVAFLADGTRIGIAHIGDSRAYMLRDGALVRLTRDHTLVQSLVDEGRITEQEAATHPRRSWLMRTLQDGSEAEPDLFIHNAVVGDRYLICSDGLTAVLDDEMVAEVLRSETDRDAAVERFVRLANAGGGPDNITCIVADLVDAPAADGEAVVVVGAASDGEPA